MNVAQQSAIIAVISVGMTFVIITAGIDLAVGSVLAFSGVVMASVLHAGLPVAVGILTGLAVGVAFGLISGLRVRDGYSTVCVAMLGISCCGRGGVSWAA